MASFLGHDINIHREFYRLPESTLQTAKVAKILLTLENNEMSQNAGQSLDNLNFTFEGLYMTLLLYLLLLKLLLLNL